MIFVACCWWFVACSFIVVVVACWLLCPWGCRPHGILGDVPFVGALVCPNAVLWHIYHKVCTRGNLHVGCTAALWVEVAVVVLVVVV